MYVLLEIYCNMFAWKYIATSHLFFSEFTFFYSRFPYVYRHAELGSADSRGLRPLPPIPKTNSQHSEPYATANGMRAIHCVVNGLLLKFGLKRSASCVCSS